ncbi:MAG: nuclear transport factor 2 family protein, partial [Thermoplasmatota archaeon]
RAVLEKLQQGYDKRDIENVDRYLEDLFTEDITIIGTGAVDKGGYEWCNGKDEARELLVSDWKNWGDLKLDIEETDINVNEDTAWLSIPGEVRIESTAEEERALFLDAVQKIVDQEKEERMIVLDLIREGVEVLYQTDVGDEYRWPIRVTGVLVHEDGWKFDQIHFAHPTTRHPDVRRMEKD